MNYIYKNQKIRIEWSIYKGTSGVLEDFSRANLKVWIIGADNMIPLTPTITDNVVVCEISEGYLAEGTYCMYAVWGKNWMLDDEKYTPFETPKLCRDVSKSTTSTLFGITQYESEATQDVSGTALVKCKSNVATYGYDGLTAYEIAVFRENFTGSLDDFGNISRNKPDEEDITFNDKELLTFKDRDTTNGLGYVILRNNKTFAEQVIKTDTIYEIRYDFDLGSTEETPVSVTIPSGCILKFKGGSITNGTLVGTNTKIDAYPGIIFGSTLTVSGTWMASYVLPEWFGAEGDGTSDDTDALVTAMSVCSTAHLPLFLTGSYKMSEGITIPNIVVQGGYAHPYNTVPASKIILGGDSNFSSTSIYNVGFIGGGYTISAGAAHVTECAFQGFSGSVFRSLSVAVIDKCSFNGNGMCITGSVDSRITNNTMNANSGDAIYLANGNNDNIIAHNKIEWNGGNGIDIYQAVHNVITGNVIDRNTYYGIKCYGTNNTITGNLLRRNCVSQPTDLYKANVLLSNSSNSFNGNVLLNGNSMDDGSGVNVPDYSVYYTNYSGSVFGNYCSQNVYSSNSDVIYANSNSLIRFEKFKSNENSIDVGGSKTFSTGIAISYPSAFNFRVGYRTTTYSNTGASIGTITISKPWNSSYTATISGLPSCLTGTCAVEDNVLKITLTSTVDELLFYQLQIY